MALRCWVISRVKELSCLRIKRSIVNLKLLQRPIIGGELLFGAGYGGMVIYNEHMLLGRYGYVEAKYERFRFCYLLCILAKT